MPSFTELYYSVGGHKADKYLKPEELHAVEGGAKYSSAHFTAKASRIPPPRPQHDRLGDGHHESGSHVAKRQPYQGEHHRTGSVGKSSTVNSQRSTYPTVICIRTRTWKPTMQSQYSLEYLRHKLTASFQLNLTTATAAHAEVSLPRPHGVIHRHGRKNAQLPPLFSGRCTSIVE